MNQPPPQPQSILLGPLQIFWQIRGDIRKSRCTTVINDTGGKFSKNFETALMVYLGASGKLIHEKNRSWKCRDTAPLNSAVSKEW